MDEVRNCSLFVGGGEGSNTRQPYPWKTGYLRHVEKKMSEAPGASLCKLQLYYINCLRAFRSLFGIESDLVALGK
jgi:hypothetical protein